MREREKLQSLYKLEAIPDTLGRMTSLESLTIDYCFEFKTLKTLTAEIGQLGALKQLTKRLHFFPTNLRKTMCERVSIYIVHIYIYIYIRIFICIYISIYI